MRSFPFRTPRVTVLPTCHPSMYLMIKSTNSQIPFLGVIEMVSACESPLLFAFSMASMYTASRMFSNVGQFSRECAVSSSSPKLQAHMDSDPPRLRVGKAGSDCGRLWLVWCRNTILLPTFRSMLLYLESAFERGLSDHRPEKFTIESAKQRLWISVRGF